MTPLKPPALPKLVPTVGQFSSYHQSRPGYYEGLAAAASMPSKEQLLNAELNPHGRPVSVQTIVSPIYGDVFRSPSAQLQNFIQATTSPLAAGAAQFVKPLATAVGSVAGGIVDAALPPSDPRYVVTYKDGARGLFMGEGPTTGGLAGQAALLTPWALGGASRTAGTLTVRNTPNNPIPKTFARVVPEGTPLSTLGKPTVVDTFVTDAKAIRGMSASQLTKALEIQPASGYHIIEFGSEGIQGIGTPVFRNNPLFTGRGLTSGGLPEYVVPNGPLPPDAIIRTVR